MVPKRSVISSFAKKEFFHIIRDPRSLVILFLMPILQLIMFGYALKMEIQQVNLAVIDFNRSLSSHHLIDQFRGSHYFRPFYFDGSIEQIETLFKARQAHAVMVIPHDFNRQLQRHRSTPVQFIVDASDANAATTIRNYIAQTIRIFNQSHNRIEALPFEVRSTIFFNPDKKSTYFFVPGIIALLLVMISAMLTSITITREKETGTLEQILVSPIKSYQIILGKVLPYIFLAFAIGVIILLIGIFLFGVPFRGSIILLLVLSTLYILTALSLGLMISTIARTQQVAMMIALISTLLPTFMLSGFIFPIASMPEILQYFTYLVPAKYYLFIARGIILKGSNLMHLLQPTIFLLIMSLVLLVISIRKFEITLED
ncbi:MAG: ABC transporter permease [Calditrichaeota bacterium]|nr:ABC transporter permease [Calditrichota bacterium]RQW06654.1 MAG: ABC transporter permease [Calditrichota bacterium]